ncbi:hypothetical protein GGF46_005318 [Coemansia sp. RSA 552]|nr:hypothetical protein GGF46_005318 [Coemansia sp. RSA 552]
MVSYTDLSPLKQPDAPVAVNLNDPLPEHPQQRRSLPGQRRSTQVQKPSREAADGHARAEEWLRKWGQLHTKVLYFKGVTEDALPELQQLFKACRGIRLNVDPHDSPEITGNVEFRNVNDTEKAMVVLNKRALKENNGTLVMSPLPDSEIEPPPNGGYVCIKHIPEGASDATLYDFLRPSGPLYSCGLAARQKGTAHACFVDSSYAHVAVEQLNFAEYLGNIVAAQISRAPRPSRASTSAAHGSARPDPTPAKQSGQHAGPLAEPDLAPIKQGGQHTGSSAQPAAPPSPAQSRPQTPSQPQGRRRTASPGGMSDGPGSGLGGVIVPGKLFVTNLHPTVSHRELFALFKKYGYIQSARVSIDSATKKSRGHGIVQFSDPNAALEALHECQGADIKGRKITMYQYEHVNRQGGGNGAVQPLPVSPRTADSQQEHEAGPHHRSPSQAGTVPFPRSSSAASSYTSDPLLDAAVLHRLSEASRNEALTQKLAAAVATNPGIGTHDVARAVDSFRQRPVEDILALLSDPALLSSEWNLEQRTSQHPALYEAALAMVPGLAVTPSQGPSPASEHSHGAAAESIAAHIQAAAAAVADSSDVDEAPLPTQGGGSRGRDYDTATEEFIELLVSKPENERKKKLGSKLFPLIKSMGYRESTKLTVWILDHMIHDVRSLAYTLNDAEQLRLVVAEAQAAIGASK